MYEDNQLNEAGVGKVLKKYDLTKVNQPEIAIDKEAFIGNVDVRYSLTIPFLNRREGSSVGIILMNPSGANKDNSDDTVNKLIDFFYDYQIDGHQIKDISICNVLPVYASNTPSALKKIRSLNEVNVLDRVQKLNEAKMAIVMKGKRLIVLGWGKPEAKTIPHLLYYKEVLRIVDLLSILHKDDLYVFDIKNAISTFTENGDPRHAGRSVILKDLIKISVPELFGLG
ncbi:DUF1643 domain-containing protein [Bacillus toyonensis]|nr:hypothetical protein bcere0017_54570 [Bacillus cereus Rock1-3]KAB2405577.1 DUF1643 domain-containing protein [Bacillus toyonensis]KXY16657.1 hypothetical protein AT259_10995 [Bacillus cereus]MBY7135739.1 DUF1643 domain-containing protein [Bacillus sp. 12RED03]PEL70563.1 DUF1643 domain-containing protein [Bacillus toyonensis]